MPVVLITGANRGIGLEFARQYAADGWEVFASCRNPKTAKDLASLVKRSGGKLTVVQMDVTDGESVRNAACQLGNKAIDLLVNNAGTSGIPGQRTGHIDYENWVRVLDVNTMGPLRVIEAFVDHIARSDRRLIVTITSGMGSLAENTSGGSIAYRTSKAAVNMAMRSVLLSLPHATSPASWSIQVGSKRAWVERLRLCLCKRAWPRCGACSRNCGVAIQASSSTTTVASIRGEQAFSTRGLRSDNGDYRSKGLRPGPH